MQYCTCNSEHRGLTRQHARHHCQAAAAPAKTGDILRILDHMRSICTPRDNHAVMPRMCLKGSLAISSRDSVLHQIVLRKSSNNNSNYGGCQLPFVTRVAHVGTCGTIFDLARRCGYIQIYGVTHGASNGASNVNLSRRF